LRLLFRWEAESTSLHHLGLAPGMATPPVENRGDDLTVVKTCQERGGQVFRILAIDTEMAEELASTSSSTSRTSVWSGEPGELPRLVLGVSPL